MQKLGQGAILQRRRHDEPPASNRFYTEALELRRVKKTVNQDDTSAYRLFFADGAGSPGADLTFFDWPVRRERGLRVDEASLEHWAAPLPDEKLVVDEPFETMGEALSLPLSLGPRRKQIEAGLKPLD